MRKDGQERNVMRGKENKEVRCRENKRKNESIARRRKSKDVMV